MQICCWELGERGGGQDHVSRKINWSFYNSREIKSAINEKKVSTFDSNLRNLWYLKSYAQVQPCYSDVFIIRPLPALRAAKRNSSKNTTGDNLSCHAISLIAVEKVRLFPNHENTLYHRQKTSTTIVGRAIVRSDILITDCVPGQKESKFIHPRFALPINCKLQKDFATNLYRKSCSLASSNHVNLVWVMKIMKDAWAKGIC